MNKHNKLQEDEENQNSNSNNQQKEQEQESRRQMNQDEIIAQISQDIEQNKYEQREGNKCQKFIMIVLYFSLHTSIIKFLLIKYDLSNIYDPYTISFWLLIIVTCILYLKITFKSPGHINSYVLRGNDFEEDVEKSLQEQQKIKQRQEETQKKKNLKEKKSILSKGDFRKRFKRQERQKSQNCTETTQNNQTLVLMTSNQQNNQSIINNYYQQVLDSSQRNTPTSKGGKFLFSTTNNQEYQLQNESSIDESFYQSKSQHNKKQIKIIAQIDKQNQKDPQNVFDKENKINPLEIITKKLQQHTDQKQTSDTDYSGNTNKMDFQKQQKEIIISEEEIMYKRKSLDKTNQLEETVEKLDQTFDVKQEEQSKYLNIQPIQEEIEEKYEEEDENQEDSSQKKNESIFNIEQKYCTVCRVEQPLRTKHCRVCNRCIATYDHHCPWVGNCIGEKNRTTFLTFLSIQLIEIVYVSYIIVEAIQLNGITFDKWDINQLFIVFLVIMCFFFLMVGSLIIIHFFLASNNLTTWEWISWNKISYMKIWPKRYGSPWGFNKSKCYNLKLYFCSPNTPDTFYQWKFPKSLPNFSDDQIKQYSYRKSILKLF